MQTRWSLALVLMACEPAESDSVPEVVPSAELSQTKNDDQPIEKKTAPLDNAHIDDKRPDGGDVETTVIQLPSQDGRCPVGMMFVPGGTFTPRQIKQFETFKKKFGRPYSKTVDDFCMDQFEFTYGKAARCFADGPCRPPATTFSFFRESPEGNRPVDVFISDSGRTVWSDELAEWPARAFRVRAKSAEKLCTRLGGRLPIVEEWMWAYWGGEQHRAFPWGSSTKILDEAKELSRRVDFEEVNPVDSFPNGIARWGHAGLGTNGQELVRTPTYSSSLFGPIEAPYSICIELDSARPGREHAHKFPCGVEEQELGSALSDLLATDDEDPDELRGIYSRFASGFYSFRCVSDPAQKDRVDSTSLVEH